MASARATAAIAEKEKEASKAEPGLLVFMKHSVALDKEKNFYNITDKEWHDKEKRPYDSPISFGSDLLAAAARKLRVRNIDAVWSSPFRVCLQTAATVARELGIMDVRVHNGLGDSSRSISFAFRRYCLVEHPFSYISLAEARQLVGDGIKLHWDPNSCVPDASSDNDERAANVVAAIGRAHPSQNVLVVTHECIFDYYIPHAGLIPSPTGYVVLKGPHGQRAKADAIIEMSRTESAKEDFDKNMAAAKAALAAPSPLRQLPRAVAATPAAPEPSWKLGGATGAAGKTSEVRASSAARAAVNPTGPVHQLDVPATTHGLMRLQKQVTSSSSSSQTLHSSCSPRSASAPVGQVPRMKAEQNEDPAEKVGVLGKLFAGLWRK